MQEAACPLWDAVVAMQSLYAVEFRCRILTAGVVSSVGCGIGKGAGAAQQSFSTL